MRLKLETDAETGKTVIRKQYSRVPLFTQRVVYPVSPSGGILHGDRYQIDITLDKNTLAHVTTQGATRITRWKRFMQAR